MSNYQIYSDDKEIKSWSSRAGLLSCEKYFLDKYLMHKDISIIEAGTGGGRISLYLYEKGYKNIVAYDFVDEMISIAKDKNSDIDFIKADATDLSTFDSELFDVAIYLQQIISLIPKEKIDLAIKESIRVTKKNGIIVYSFLYFKGRRINRFLSPTVNFIRFFRGEKYDKNYLPWLKKAGKLNYRFLSKNEPCVYWFDKDEILKKLQKFSLKIIEVKTMSDFKKTNEKGMLYIVCQK